MGAIASRTGTFNTQVPALGRLVEHVRQRSRDYFPAIGGVRTVRVTAVYCRPYSVICRIAVESDSAAVREVVIKSCPGAGVQFRGMLHVWPHFAAHPTWKIPRPLEVIDEGPALVMEAVSGTSLQARLPWLPWRRRSLAAAAADCRRAGQWLRFYHDLGRTGERKALDVAAKWEDAEESLAALVEAGLDRAHCARISDALQALAARVSGQPLAISHVHGEFTIDNLFLDGDRLTALDLWGEHRNAVHHDLASFLNSLHLLRLTRPAISRTAIARLGREFFHGYFGSEGYDPSAVLFVQAVGLADVGIEICRRRRSPVARAWIGHVLTGVFQEILQPPERTRR